MSSKLHLGFEAGTGDPITIPLKHMAITGQTQEAGKTTALEALITRSELRAVTFITKRGEGSFTNAHRVKPYFREKADWQYVAAILEANRGEKLKFERAWIIRASRGATTLRQVHENVKRLQATSKRGMDADVYLTLDAYLEIVVPQISQMDWADSLDLRAGVNAVDLTHLSYEMQHLVIRSTIEWVAEKEEKTIIVVPEAWKFIPQGRGTPVKLAVQSFIRQGAGIGNYLWLDSQDIGGIDKEVLRSVPLWILGVQREANEIKRTLDNIPAGTKKPKAADIATLKLGHFFACWSTHAFHVYVQPLWLSAESASAVAKTGVTPPPPPQPKPKKEAMSYDQEIAKRDREIEDLKKTVRRLEEQLRDTDKPSASDVKQPPAAAGDAQKLQMGRVDINATEREISITFSQETRSFNTDDLRGRIMFVIVHDLKNSADGPSVLRAMGERGWSYIRQTVNPAIGTLVKNGDLISEGNNYRLPGKLKLTIDGKKIQ